MSSSDPALPDPSVTETLRLRQIIADIDLKREQLQQLIAERDTRRDQILADTLAKQQQVLIEPRKLLLQAAAVGFGLAGAGAALATLFMRGL